MKKTLATFALMIASAGALVMPAAAREAARPAQYHVRTVAAHRHHHAHGRVHHRRAIRNAHR